MASPYRGAPGGATLRTHRPGKDAGSALLVAALALACAAPGAAAQAPAYVPWTDVLPASTSSSTEYQSGLNGACPDDGSVDTYACVQATIDEMAARYDALHSSCDHRGLFALAYLRTTEEYQRAAATAGFFDDPELVNHEDTIFARLYFQAYDDWQAGRVDAVPRAWRIAFRASTEPSVTTLGDVLLGISAHINRDLPYTLATMGLNDPETAASRKPDHDKVNAFLARVPARLFAEIDQYWDPAFDDQNTLLDVTTPTAIPIVQEWREAAWRWAERLIDARTAAERKQVERGIEQYAYGIGSTIRQMTALAPGQTTGARDAYCAAQQG
jgi:hypothetical protein